MIRSLAWLTVLWVALWGDVSPGSVMAGIALAVALEVAFPSGAPVAHKVKVLPAVAFGFFMLRAVVTSSLRVMVAVLRPTPERAEVHLVDVPLTSTSPSVVSVTVNTISLTPGTLTIDHHLDSNVITVHVLGRVDEDRFREQMLEHERRVLSFLAPTTPNGGRA
ncbi:MAG: Na+/H+ antiporter subunit E [Ilumatobacteraceae bacterium]